jgi:hypothetical protein
MSSGQITRLDLLAPSRAIGTSRRALTGRLSLGEGARAGFESSLERDWLICLDFHPTVTLIREQPFSIHYESDRGTRRYTPDVLAQFAIAPGQRSTVVYEVKPQDELKSSFAEHRCRFKKAVAFCRAKGWRFKIVTEKHIRTPFLDNAKFLRKYRAFAVQELYRDQLLYSLRALGPTCPQALLALAYLSDEKRMAALTELWRMVACREIGAELARPLTMRSAIWLHDR